MSNLQFLVKLSENEKRTIIAALLILILLFVIIGLIVAMIQRKLKSYAKGIDTYVSDMLRYGILTKPRHVISYVSFRETKLLIRKLLIPTAVFTGALIFYLIWAAAAGTTLGEFGATLGDLGVNLSWPTNKFFGLTIVSDWPKLAENSGPHFHLDKMHVYIAFLASVVYGFMLMRRSLILMARCYRARKMADKVFHSSLDDLHVEAR